MNRHDPPCFRPTGRQSAILSRIGAVRVSTSGKTVDDDRPVATENMEKRLRFQERTSVVVGDPASRKLDNSGHDNVVSHRRLPLKERLSNRCCVLLGCDWSGIGHECNLNALLSTRQKKGRASGCLGQVHQETHLLYYVFSVKHLIAAMLLLVTLVACSDGSSASCDLSGKRDLLSALAEANRGLTAAVAELSRIGPLTRQNSEAYGVAEIRQETAKLKVQIAKDELVTFADTHPTCFTAEERFQLLGG